MASSTITVGEPTEWVIVQYYTDEITFIRKVVRFNEIQVINLNLQSEAVTAANGSAEPRKPIFIKDGGRSFIGTVIYQTVDEHLAKIRHKSHEFLCMRMLASQEDLTVDMTRLNSGDNIWLLIMCISSKKEPNVHKTVFKMLQKEKVHLESGKKSDHVYAYFGETNSMLGGMVIAASCSQSDIKDMMDIISDDLVKFCEANLIDTEEQNIQISRQLAEMEKEMYDQWETLDDALQMMNYRKYTAVQTLNWLLTLAELNNLHINLSDF